MKKVALVLFALFSAVQVGFAQNGTKEVIKGYLQNHFRITTDINVNSAFSVLNGTQFTLVPIQNGTTLMQEVELRLDHAKGCAWDKLECIRPDSKTHLRHIAGLRGLGPFFFSKGKDKIRVYQPVVLRPGDSFPIPVPGWWLISGPSTLAVAVDAYDANGNFVGSTYPYYYTAPWGYNYHQTWTVRPSDIPSAGGSASFWGQKYVNIQQQWDALCTPAANGGKQVAIVNGRCEEVVVVNPK